MGERGIQGTKGMDGSMVSHHKTTSNYLQKILLRVNISNI